jgi:RDD family/DnaJ domain
MTDENYYEELGVEPSASRDEIRDAHRARVADLEAAREKKGITDAQLQQNREQVARVRAAWNVLSDPFQRKRYDAQVDAGPGEEIDLVDAEAGDAAPEPGTEQPLTGWRKLMAPPPPKNAGGKNGAGSNPTAPAGNKRPRPEPTIVLPAGMQLAEPRVRGMALLFDISILIVIFFGVSLLVPGLIQSDYHDIQDKITNVNDLHDARQSLTDAEKSVADAKTAADTKSAQSDLKSAQSDYDKAKKDASKAGVTNTSGSAQQLQTQADKLTDKIRTTGYVTSGITLVLGLAYLVPITARKGYTLGMRNRRIKVVRVDGSPAGWYASFTRFALPLLFAVAIPSFGAILGLGMVAWGYFDRNGQGIHDKLARTVVVAA